MSQLTTKSLSWLSVLFGRGKTQSPAALHLQFVKMLDIAAEMYTSVLTAILDAKPDAPDITERIEQLDDQLADLEQDIRRDILVALSASDNVAQDITGMLSLLRLVTDAERLGDFCKNIHRVYVRESFNLNDDQRAILRTQHAWLVPAFAQLKQALLEQEADLAKAITKQAREYIQICGRTVDGLIADPTASVNPVAAALVFRLHKRLLSHFSHISLAVFMPYDDSSIDFDQIGV